MLDIGIGAGRTTEFFAPLVRTYVGIDYSPRMVEEARGRLSLQRHATVVVADARDLSRWHGRAFDVVLFSFNGIDAVDEADRPLIFDEIRRVVADDGVFAFSTHSLSALPLSLRPRRPSLRAPLRSTVRSLRRTARLAALNRSLDLDVARARGWARVRDGAHDFSLVLTYVDPAYQLRQLDECGFEVSEVLNARGRPLDPLDPGREAHLFYICRPHVGRRSP
jgi:SAM-dependent methyltransferase